MDERIINEMNKVKKYGFGLTTLSQSEQDEYLDTLKSVLEYKIEEIFFWSINQHQEKPDWLPTIEFQYRISDYFDKSFYKGFKGYTRRADLELCFDEEISDIFYETFDDEYMQYLDKTFMKALVENFGLNADNEQLVKSIIENNHLISVLIYLKQFYEGKNAEATQMRSFLKYWSKCFILGTTNYNFEKVFVFTE